MDGVGNGSSAQKRPRSPTSDTADAADTRDGSENAAAPKPKRLACMICRKRKLKCDGVKPSCSTCSRLGHLCAYDEVRRKSGPKRGYVKALEERLSEHSIQAGPGAHLPRPRLSSCCRPALTNPLFLEQVETLLKTQDPAAALPEQPKTVPIVIDAASGPRNSASATATSFNVANSSIGIATDRDMDRWHFNGESPQAPNMDDFNFNSNISMGMGNVGSNFTWEMIGLGLEEPLPPQETIDELYVSGSCQTANVSQRILTSPADTRYTLKRSTHPCR